MASSPSLAVPVVPAGRSVASLLRNQVRPAPVLLRVPLALSRIVRRGSYSS
jgi:hypothetical protein